MKLGNTPDRYGAVSKAFHWLSALLVIGLLCVGLYMTNAEKSAALFPLYGLHKSFGIVVLAVTFLRVLWHLASKKPALVDDMKKWEKAAAKGAHHFLYLCMFAMPLSGWLMSSAKGRTVKLFDTVTLPDLVGKNAELGDKLADFHELCAWVLIGVIILHATAALKHHFIEKDVTLKRMLPFYRIKE